MALLFAILCAASGLVAVHASVTSCCASLSKALPGKVSFPLGVAYIASETSYWSQQEASIAPLCIVSPTQNTDVAAALKILYAAYNKQPGSCNFAIRGAGHTPWAGAANIQGGITIDMRAINQVTVNGDETIASVGAGARWRDVSSTLDPMNLAVAGGRVSEVGVGGLVIGGGVSFFSPRVGFVCDNVQNFEVVLADGTITNANANQNPDLWKALKGGSNNFGVITRYDLEAFQQGNIWGGFIYYNLAAESDYVINAFHNFDNATGYDEYASMIQSSVYEEAIGFVGVNNLVYTKPISYPSPTYDAYKALPKTVDTTRIVPLTSVTDELALTSPPGQREIFITTTFKNDLDFLHTVYDLWNASVNPVKHVTGIGYEMSWQSVPPAITGQSAAKGGNVLGLSPDEGALVNLLLSCSWLLSTDDNLVTQTASNFINSVDSAAAQKGVSNPYKYLNYAYSTQKPIQGYGSDNVAFLQTTSKKYDPNGVFQKGVPGGFKLFT